MTEKIVFKTGLTGAGQDGIYLAAGSPGAGGAGGDGGSNGAAGSPGLVRLIFVLPTGSPPPLRCQGCKMAGWPCWLAGRAGVAPPTCGHATLMGIETAYLRPAQPHGRCDKGCARSRLCGVRKLATHTRLLVAGGSHQCPTFVP